MAIIRTAHGIEEENNAFRVTLHVLNAPPFGTKLPRSSLNVAAFAGQAQGLGTEGGVITPAFDRLGMSFMTIER